MGVALDRLASTTREEDTPVMIQNTRLLAIALSLASLTACDHKSFAVLDDMTFQSTGHQQNFVDTTEDEPSIPPKAAEPIPSVEYVPPPEPPKIPCTEGQTRLFWCIDGFRVYI